MSYTNLVIIFKILVIIKVVRMFVMKKKSKFSLIIICLVITLVSIGLSYAYWRFTFISDKANKEHLVALILNWLKKKMKLI